MIDVLIGLVTVGALVALFWRFIGPKSGAVAPLEAPADDAEMAAARQRARQTISVFRDLYKAHPESSMVKVPFVSSSGVTEHVAASVLELFEDAILVRIESDPVTHRDKFERIQRFRLDELSDWLVILPSGRRRGGYTMQVQFARRKSNGSLPPELAAEEKLYDWDT